MSAAILYASLLVVIMITIVTISLQSTGAAAFTASTTRFDAMTATSLPLSSSSTLNWQSRSSDAGSRTRLYNDLWGKEKEDDDESSTSPPIMDVKFTKDIEKSKAMPFLPRPKLLDGALAADVGFDPFNFAGGDKASLLNMREAEVKHSRLAMLAVIGWPLAELYDAKIAQSLQLPILLTKKGLSPSILNGGLDKIDTFYWVAVILLAGIIEIENDKTKTVRGNDYLPGDCNFDPFSFYPKRKEEQYQMQTKEIKHGRIAMMAIVGYVVAELLYQKPIIAITPEFFQPIF